MYMHLAGKGHTETFVLSLSLQPSAREKQSLVDTDHSASASETRFSVPASEAGIHVRLC